MSQLEKAIISGRKSPSVTIKDRLRRKDERPTMVDFYAYDRLYGIKQTRPSMSRIREGTRIEIAYDFGEVFNQKSHQAPIWSTAQVIEKRKNGSLVVKDTSKRWGGSTFVINQVHVARIRKPKKMDIAFEKVKSLFSKKTQRILWGAGKLAIAAAIIFAIYKLFRWLQEKGYFLAASTET